MIKGLRTVTAIVLFMHAAAHGDTKPSIDWTLVHGLTMRGIDQLYSLDTDGALRTFDSVATIAPQDPRGYFFKSVVHFSLYALERDRRHFDAFMEDIDRVIEVCERKLKNNSADAGAKFYLGGAYGYRGMMHQTEGSLFKALMDGRKGYGYLEDAVIEKPDLYDAHMGFGMFRYLTAKAPKSLHWALKLIGITPDLEGGLRSLKYAAERGTYTRNEARFLLAQFLFNEERDDEAFRHLESLCNKYPENTLFLILRATWHERRGNHSEALADAQRALQLNAHRPIRHVEQIACAVLGNIAFAMNDFASARDYFERHIEGFGASGRVSNRLWYRFAVSHEVTGNRSRAVAIASRAVERSDARAWDMHYYRKAKELQSRPMNEADIFILRASNLMDARDHLGALTLYQKADTLSVEDPDRRGQALLGILRAQMELSMLADAEQTAARLLVLKPSRERWVIPHGYLVLGQVHSRAGRRDDALRAFKSVKEFDDYDFQGRVERRVEQELKQLGER